MKGLLCLLLGGQTERPTGPRCTSAHAHVVLSDKEEAENPFSGTLLLWKVGRIFYGDKSHSPQPWFPIQPVRFQLFHPLLYTPSDLN